jgi:hypothetical protein
MAGASPLEEKAEKFIIESLKDVAAKFLHAVSGHSDGFNIQVYRSK